MPLGPGRSVHLIRAGRELVLVGSAEHGIVPIRTYTEDEAQALGLLADPALGPGDDDAPRGTGPADRVRYALGDTLDRLRQRTAR
jgi:flagellar protein FliO/FliZ